MGVQPESRYASFLDQDESILSGYFEAIISFRVIYF